MKTRKQIMHESKKVMKKIREASATDSKMEALIKDLEDKTNRNDHGGACERLAQFTQNKKYQDICKAINQIHDAEGSIPHEVQQYRDSVLKEMLNWVKSKFGKDVHDRINQAF